MTSALAHSSAHIGAAISRYQPSVRRALRGAGVRARDVEDLSQDVFAIFCRRYAEIAEPAQRSFLLQTARRVAADHRRLKWNQALFLELPIQADRLHGNPLQPPQALGEPASEAERRQLKQLMIDALSVLPDQEKHVFLLTHSEGLSRTEISDLLCVPAGTVASRLRRANQLYASCIARMDPPLDRVSGGADSHVPWRAPGRGAQRIALPARSEILHGKYVASDNQWGHARCAGLFDQCLLTRQVDGETQLGWTWNWSTFEAKGFALPELIAGWKPWSGGRATDPRFPVPLANIAHLAVDFDVELRAEGAYNLLIDLWFLRSAPRDAHADLWRRSPSADCSSRASGLEASSLAIVSLAEQGKPGCAISTSNSSCADASASLHALGIEDGGQIFCARTQLQLVARDAVVLRRVLF